MVLQWIMLMSMNYAAFRFILLSVAVGKKAAFSVGSMTADLYLRTRGSEGLCDTQMKKEIRTSLDTKLLQRVHKNCDKDTEV